MTSSATSSATASATSCTTHNVHGNAINTPSCTTSPIRKTTSPAPKSSSSSNNNNIHMTPTKVDETAISAAARIKQKNEAQTFSLFGGGTSSSSSSSTPHVKDAPPLSSNAYASSSTTNSYNVLTDRPTSRVVSYYEDVLISLIILGCFFS